MSIEKARMAARKALERMYQGRATPFFRSSEISEYFKQTPDQL